MKKIIFLTIAVLIAAPLSWAAQVADEDRDMEALRHKIATAKRQLNTLMHEVVSTYPTQDLSAQSGYGSDVKVDVVETEREIVIRADMPGMEKDKIDISLENSRVLKLSGSREVIQKQTAPGMVKQERAIGSFQRVIELPSEGMSSGIKASYKDGVLEVIIPKKVPSKQAAVKIKVD